MTEKCWSNWKMLSQGKVESISLSKLISYHQHFLTVCTGQTLETKCCQMITHLIPTSSFQVWHLLCAWIIKNEIDFFVLLFSAYWFDFVNVFSPLCSPFFLCAFRPPLPLSPHYPLHFHLVVNLQLPRTHFQVIRVSWRCTLWCLLPLLAFRPFHFH